VCRRVVLPEHALLPNHPTCFSRASLTRGNESDEAKIGQLESDLELAGLKLAESVPLIASMLNVPVGEKYSPLTLSPDQKRKRLLATLAGWLFGTSRAQPIVMAIEDLHWFDASTLELNAACLSNRGRRAGC